MRQCTDKELVESIPYWAGHAKDTWEGIIQRSMSKNEIDERQAELLRGLLGMGQMTKNDTNDMFKGGGQQPSQAFTLEYCDYMGKRCRVISKNYQDGTAVIEAQDLTGPYTIVVQISAITPTETKKNYGNICTCGVSSVGSGKHSDWCDKYNSWD